MSPWLIKTRTSQLGPRHIIAVIAYILCTFQLRVELFVNTAALFPSKGLLFNSWYLFWISLQWRSNKYSKYLGLHATVSFSCCNWGFAFVKVYWVKSHQRNVIWRKPCWIPLCQLIQVVTRRLLLTNSHPLLIVLGCRSLKPPCYGQKPQETHHLFQPHHIVCLLPAISKARQAEKWQDGAWLLQCTGAVGSLASWKSQQCLLTLGVMTDSLAQTENKIYVAQINTQSDFYYCGAAIQALLSISPTWH